MDAKSTSVDVSELRTTVSLGLSCVSHRQCPCSADSQVIGGIMKRAIVLLVAIVVACTSLPNETASLQGTVVDREGNPLPGVTVTAGTQTVITDAKGHYEFANLPTGKYVVIAKLEGFNEGRLRISVNGKPVRH